MDKIAKRLDYAYINYFVMEDFTPHANPESTVYWEPV